METFSSVGTLFTAIAVIFVIAVFRDFLKEEGKMTIARRVWLRLALIFAFVGIGLYFVQMVLR